MVNNRSRGARGEREFAELIGGKKVSRTGYPGPDVVGEDGTVYEVKRIKRMPALLASWLRQMSEEGATVIAFRADRSRWIVMKYYEDEKEI